MATISFYKNVKHIESKETVLLSIFLDAVQSGKWQDQVLKIRTIQDTEMRRAAKAAMPNVTISGIFGKRVDNDLKAHSGFIAIDLDDLGLEAESTKELLKSDPYIYAVFVSISGKGLCAIVKIDAERHRDSFDGISDYLVNKYQLVVDPTGINLSRPRFVSYDPGLYINEGSLKFKKYLPKEKKRDMVATIFVQTEFDEIVKKMVDENVSCCEDYRDWRNIAFGLFDQFGKNGRDYFHQLSGCSQKYEKTMVDDMFDHASKRKDWDGKKVTIATIYWFAKKAGISILSEQTKKVASATSSGKKSGLDAKTIAKNLKQFEGIDGVDQIIQQAFESNKSFIESEHIVDNIRMWIRHNFDLKKNVITRKIEDSGTILEEADFNTMFLDAYKMFDKVTADLFNKVIHSRNTPEYNPIIDFIKSIEWDGEKRLDDLGASINSATGTMEWRCLMVRRWYIGIVSSVFGVTNELNLILVGGKNTGKTWFFKHLLPSELMIYFALSQLNKGTDDEILMCERLLILNDEYGGKNKTDERTEKRLMASDYFSLRVPYGRGNETIRRLATLAGTCNDLDVLDDATGNRRIIVIQSAGKFNFQHYNSLDKYQLIAEAYAAFMAGERPELSDSEIDILETTTDGAYSKVIIEGELISQHFLAPGQTNPWDFMTATQVKVYLENHTRAILNINRIGSQLRKMGYNRYSKGTSYGYDIAPIPVIL